MKQISRIVCVGNSLVADDAIGILVYHELLSRQCDDHIEIIEGGLCGINLLPWFEDCQKIVLVDRVIGFGEPGAALHLDLDTICKDWQEAYSHSGGLLYLLKSLPFLQIEPMPSVCMIGIEGAGGRDIVRRAADLALEAVHENV